MDEYDSLRQPLYNWQLDYINNLEAAGELGIIKVNEIFYLQAAKYTWNDRWNMLFDSLSAYYGSAHPDYTSHGFTAYGSMKEYWKQASNGHFDLQPYITHPNETDYKLKTGIVNDYIDVNGQKVIKTLMMPKNKFGTENSNSYFRNFYDAADLVDKAEMLADDADSVIYKYTNFNLETFRENGGILMIVFLGGSNSFKGVGFGNKRSFVVRGRRNPITSMSISRTDGFGISAHEFAHLQFNWNGHVNAARYCIMNIQEVHHPDCPQLPNPVYRMREGWLDPITYDHSQYIDSLPPIETSYKCGVLTIYGKPSAKPDWTCGESYVFENRKKIGFDRFLAPYASSQFYGGLLVWKYSPYNTFLQDTNCGNNFKTDVELVCGNNDSILCGSQGIPEHFFAYSSDSWANHTLVSNRTTSSFGLRTGIVLRNIQQNNYIDTFSTIRLDIDYTIEEPPDYNIVLYGQTFTHDTTFNGNVYVHNNANFLNLSINSGTTIDFVKEFISVYGSSSNPSVIKATGEELNPVNLRGAGYGDYRISAVTDCIVLNDYDNYSTDTNIFIYCNIDKSAGGLSVNSVNSTIKYSFQNITIQDTSKYLTVYGGTSSNPPDYAFIIKYSNNNCNLSLSNRIKFNIMNDIIINQNKKLKIINSGGVRGFCELDISNNNKLLVNGTATIAGSLNMNKNIFISGTGKIYFGIPQEGPSIIKFSPGFGINCEGDFHSQGGIYLPASVDKSVTFDRNGDTGFWNGITCYNSNSLYMDSTILKNSLNGIQISHGTPDIDIAN